ncbi:hypothetical protein [Mesorhizobium sp. CN2-181]|uniref:hypothetical protein n=1 Tax=Mesorhizobium yinganensis TaxID=3157707 RepID=UPI0032B79B7F
MLRYAVLGMVVASVAGTAIFLAASTGPTLAQDWTAFGFRKAGIIFTVPPGFSLDHIAEDGQAATFLGPLDASLVVRGDHILGGNFKQRVEALIADDARRGWKVTYRRLTESWASYSGIKGGMIRYVRVIVTCDDSVGVFVMDYRQSQKLPYDPVVLRMVKSLASEGC